MVEDVQNVYRSVFVLPNDMLVHITFYLAAVIAVGTLEARLLTALVSEMPRQISLPIEGFRAIACGTTIDATLLSFPSYLIRVQWYCL